MPPLIITGAEKVRNLVPVFLILEI